MAEQIQRQRQHSESEYSTRVQARVEEEQTIQAQQDERIQHIAEVMGNVVRVFAEIDDVLAAA